MRTVIIPSLVAVALAFGMAGQASAHGCLDRAGLVDKWSHLDGGAPAGLQDNAGLANAETHAQPGGDPLFETICTDSGRGNGNERIGDGDPGASFPQNNGGDPK